MSQALSSVAQEEFDSEVKHAYQGLKTLRDCVKVRNNVVGDTYDFRKMGSGVASARTGSSADVVPMNVGHSLVPATLTDWEAPEYTDIYDQATVNFDEVQELATTVAGAMGRRDDQSIITSLALSTNTLVAATLNLAAITGAAQKLNEVEAPMEDRYFVVSEVELNNLLNDPTITSSDYNTVQLLMQGSIDTFMGFKWRIIGSARAEGGLATNCYAYHKASVGHAVGIDMKTSVDWIAHKSSWLSNGMWKGGSALIDETGVVKITKV